MTMMDTDSTRIETLRRARQRQPWTVELIVECASDPVEFKAQLPACAVCPEPCETDEVCATAVGKSEALFESMGREQAYHLIENGMQRLRTRDDAAVRTADRERPNTFLRLQMDDSDAVELTDDSDDHTDESREQRGEIDE